MLNSKVLTNSIILFSTLFVAAIFVYGFGLEFFYDDFITLKNYSSDELKDSLTNSWSLDRLENPGFRPLFNYIFDSLWNNFGINPLFYSLFQSFLIFLQGAIIYRLFKLFSDDSLLNYLLTLLVLIFTDQFLWRIFIVEIPSLISSVILLYGILIILSDSNYKKLILSYILLLIASLIKETNFLFIFTPLIITILNQKKFFSKLILIQYLFLGSFSAIYISMRSSALEQVPAILQMNYGFSIKIINLLINFSLEFPESLGLNKFTGIVLIPIIALFLLFKVKNIGLNNLLQSFFNLSNNIKLILFLLLCSMGSFPFYSAGRLRGYFVIFLATLFIIIIKYYNYNRRNILIFLSGLIVVNGLNNILLTKKYIREKYTLSTMIYFNPMYRISMHLGEAESQIDYLEKSHVNTSAIKSYSKIIKSIKEKDVYYKDKFIDDLGIEFIQLKINNDNLNIMKYEFSEFFLNGFSGFYFLHGIPSMPIHGAWRNQVFSLIEHLNKKSNNYNYRLPTVSEYNSIASGVQSVFDTPINKFESKNIKEIEETLENKFGIHGLYNNVNEWTSDDISTDFGLIFGGDAHVGNHSIVFADQSQRLDGHHTKFYGFRLIAEEK